CEDSGSLLGSITIPLRTGAVCPYSRLTTRGAASRCQMLSMDLQAQRSTPSPPRGQETCSSTACTSFPSDAHGYTLTPPHGKAPGDFPYSSGEGQYALLRRGAVVHGSYHGRCRGSCQDFFLDGTPRLREGR